VIKRERILLVVAAALLVGVVGYLVTARLYLARVEALNVRIVNTRGEIEKLEGELAREPQYRKRFAALVDRAHAGDEMAVSEAARAMLDDLLHESGLGTYPISLTPLTGRPLRGVGRELGWNVRTRGRLANVVDFLYLVEVQPILHRVDNLILQPVAKSTDVDIQFRYTTLALEAAREKPRREDTVLAGDLAGPDRKRYEAIVERDLFRPYIRREVTRVAEATPPPTVPKDDRPPPPPPPPPPQENAAARFRVAGLPTWGGRQDIQVVDTQTKQARYYGPGDMLAGGEIVMIDYRPLPHPADPTWTSTSRVILKIGKQYFAVEIGQTLADRRKLAPADLPPALRQVDEATEGTPPADTESAAAARPS
jgi:hypothetical protein